MFEAINIEWNNTDSSSCKKLPANVGKAIPCKVTLSTVFMQLLLIS